MAQEERKNNEQMQELVHKLSNYIAANLDSLLSESAARRTEAIMDIIMKAERSVHLDGKNNDKANGFYERPIGSPLGKLNINVPRDRDGDFRSQILPPPYQRDSVERTDLIQALLSASYTPSGISSVLKDLGMHYSDEEVKKLQKKILVEFEAWSNRELENDYVAIFIDAYHSEIMENGSIKKLVVYSVLSIDFEGKKDLCGIYISIGSETKEFWLKVFNDLIKRGLKRLILIVSDEFGGIKDAVSTLFPKALHQLCLNHLQRNVRRNMGKGDAKELNNTISKIKNYSKSYQDGKISFVKAFASYKNKYPAFISHVEENIDNYIAFFHFPVEIRKYFYTTNSVESFNSILESIRLKSGGFFQSQETLKTNIYLKYVNP